MAAKLTKFSFLLKCGAISALLCIIVKVIVAKDYGQTDLDGPIVNIDGLGQVVGSITYGRWTNKTIYQFLGLRYAKSPKTTGRFKVRDLKWKIYPRYHNSRILAPGFLSQPVDLFN